MKGMMHWWFWGLPFLGTPMYFGRLRMLLMILFWVIFIGLIFLLVRVHCHYYHNHYEENEALQILKRLYAEGKISEEEFERRKKKILE
jgi:uncharacterized membrane protein